MLETTGPMPLSEFEDKAAAFLTEHRRTLSAKTTQRRLGTYRSFGKWAGVPCLADYRAPTPPRAIPHPLPEGVAGVSAMVEAARSDQHKALVALCGLQGLRVEEAITVRAADVDITNGILTVHGKGDKFRHIPLFPDAIMAFASALVAARENGLPLVPITNRAARKAITRIGARAGISRPVSSHDLRATFATEAYNRSLDLRAVQELLGHSSSSTTELYTGVSMGKMRMAGGA